VHSNKKAELCERRAHLQRVRASSTESVQLAQWAYKMFSTACARTHTHMRTHLPK